MESETVSSEGQHLVKSPSEYIGLNVGGVLYRTCRSTLTRYPNSMLGAMFTSSMTPAARDEHGNYLIDGDGEIFRHILNFLRRGDLCLPEGFRFLDLLQKEADFYQIQELSARICAYRLAENYEKAEYPRTNTSTNFISHGGVVEVCIREKDDEPHVYRIYGSLVTLQAIPQLTEYLENYRKGSQCLEFYAQHAMFPSHTYRRFPKTKLFDHICHLGYRLHSTDCINVVDTEGDDTPWLRYVFVMKE
ncbi:uncharacterized protein [Diadema antillarum]|uniref:uncharacterized protein n=1 Tax=Diadema antillarum TaxID=105358 RepID=UPI003A8ACAC3